MFEHIGVNLGYKDMIAETSETGRVYLTPKGEKYPSITTVLSILSRASIQKWRERVGEAEANKISTQASRRGTLVHEMIEKYINNDDYKKGAMPYVLPSFYSVQSILDERIGKVYAQEVPLYSDYLGVAGRVDCIAEWDGKISIIDFKTSKKLKKREWITSYFMQEAFYAIAFEELTGTPITQLVTLVAVDNEKPQVFIEHRDDWVKGLMNTIDEYKLEKGITNDRISK